MKGLLNGLLKGGTRGLDYNSYVISFFWKGFKSRVFRVYLFLQLFRAQVYFPKGTRMCDYCMSQSFTTSTSLQRNEQPYGA